MSNAMRQGGFTLGGLVIVFAVIGFFALIFMRLLPVYMEWAAVKGAVIAVAAEMPAKASLSDVRKAFGKRLEINNVKAVSAKDLMMGQETGQKIISIGYEGRAPFLSNISFVVDFYQEATLGDAP